MRKVCLAAALALALGSGAALAQTAAGQPDILVSGVQAPGGGPAGAGDRAAIEHIIDAAYASAARGQGGKPLTRAQLQSIADQVTQTLRQAGYAHAQAYLSDQVVAFHLPSAPGGHAVAAALPGAAPAAGTPAAPAANPNAVPPVSQRQSGTEASQRVSVRGFEVEGVGHHPDDGITPDSIQAVADKAFHKLGGGAGHPVALSFQQMQDVADTITDRYRKAGFIVATAFLPAQTVGRDHRIRIQVLEGKIGRILVRGAKRYRPWVIAAPAEKLRGRPLRKSAVDTALLYDRDLPGVSVTSTFQPGLHTGETDLVMIAREAKRPFSFTVGANNYGTDLTGRYRAQAGATWESPLGIGDSLAASVDYGFDPQQNAYGSLVYRAPTVVVPGLSGVVGGTRSSLQINTGPFASLGVKGPSELYFAGADWKFVNHDDLKMQASLQMVHEQAKLTSLGSTLSDERFNVAQLSFGMERTDHRFHGLDLLQVSVRKSVNDQSRQPDLVSPDHARSFLVEKLSYTRLQFLTRTQRLYFKFVGQYTRDALAPLEQFAIGGPDSVRAYPIADGLADRGFYTSLEYHVDAPGFSNVISPFYNRPWRELLEFEAFVDYARGYAAGANRLGNPASVTYSGAGAGLIFRLPRFHHFEFHLDGSVPIGSRKASDKQGYHIYSRFGFKF